MLPVLHLTRRLHLILSACGASFFCPLAWTIFSRRECSYIVPHPKTGWLLHYAGGQQFVANAAADEDI